MRPNELTILPKTSTPDTGSSMDFHSSPHHVVSCKAGNLNSMPLADDKLRQCFETALSLIPNCCAASRTDENISHVFAPSTLHRTCLDVPGPALLLCRVVTEWLMFWLWLAYSKFSKRLFAFWPSMWFTCHASWLGGRPWNEIMITRWTGHFFPRIPTMRYPDGCKYPCVITPLGLQTLPNELTCQPELTLSGWLDKSRPPAGISHCNVEQTLHAQCIEPAWIWRNIATLLMNYWKYCYDWFQFVELEAEYDLSHSSRTDIIESSFCTQWSCND